MLLAAVVVPWSLGSSLLRWDWMSLPASAVGIRRHPASLQGTTQH